MKREFGNRTFGVYLGMIVGMSLLAGALLDLAIARFGLPVPTIMVGDHVHGEAGARWAAWLFGILTLASLWRRLRKRIEH